MFCYWQFISIFNFLNNSKLLVFIIQSKSSKILFSVVDPWSLLFVEEYYIGVFSIFRYPQWSFYYLPFWSVLPSHIIICHKEYIYCRYEFLWDFQYSKICEHSINSSSLVCSSIYVIDEQTINKSINKSSTTNLCPCLLALGTLAIYRFWNGIIIKLLIPINYGMLPRTM